MSEVVASGEGVAARWRAWSPHLPSLPRVVTGFPFAQIGTARLFAFPAAIMPGGGVVTVPRC